MTSRLDGQSGRGLPFASPHGLETGEPFRQLATCAITFELADGRPTHMTGAMGRGARPGAAAGGCSWGPWPGHLAGGPGGLTNEKAQNSKIELLGLVG